MANKYIYDLTFEDKHMEEDREVLNDYYRARTDYYITATNINLIVLNTLENMSTNEIKNTIMINPVVRLNNL